MARSWYTIRYYEDGAEYYYCGSFSLSVIDATVNAVFKNYPKVNYLKILRMIVIIRLCVGGRII